MGFVLITGSAALGAVQSNPVSAVKGPNDRAVIQKAFRLQMPFIANEGQIKDEGLRFYAQIFAGTLYMAKKGEIVHSL